MRNLFRQYPSLRHMAVSGTGSLVAPLVTLATILLLTLFYDPEAYGLWAVLMSLALIPGAVATLRYELGVVLAESEDEAGSVFMLSLLLAALVALATWALTAAAARLLPAWEYAGGLLPWLWTVPLLVFLTAFSQACDAWCTRRQAFGVRAVSLIVLAALSGAVQIGACLAGAAGVGGLILGTLAGNLVASAILLTAVLGRSPAGFFEGFRWRRLRPTAKKYRNFPLFSVPYTFVGTLRQQGVTLLFGSFAAGAAVGLYSFAYRLTSFPVGLFTNGIRPVLFERAARQPDLRAVQPFVENLLYALSAACLPGMVWFLARADAIFEAALPARWDGVAPYARLLILPAVAFVHTNWMDRILDVLRLQRLALLLELAFSTACLLGLAFGLLVLRDPVLATALQASAFFAYNAYYLYVVYREAEFGRRGLWQYVRYVAIFSAACALGFAAADAWLPLYVSDAAFLVLAYAGAAALLARRFARFVRGAAPALAGHAARMDSERPVGAGA